MPMYTFRYRVGQEVWSEQREFNVDPVALKFATRKFDRMRRANWPAITRVDVLLDRKTLCMKTTTGVERKYEPIEWITP